MQSPTDHARWYQNGDLSVLICNDGMNTKVLLFILQRLAPQTRLVFLFSARAISPFWYHLAWSMNNRTFVFMPSLHIRTLRYRSGKIHGRLSRPAHSRLVFLFSARAISPFWYHLAWSVGDCIFCPKEQGSEGLTFAI
jgi:hypothetical protein